MYIQLASAVKSVKFELVNKFILFWDSNFFFILRSVVKGNMDEASVDLFYFVLSEANFGSDIPIN